MSNIQYPQPSDRACDKSALWKIFFAVVVLGVSASGYAQTLGGDLVPPDQAEELKGKFGYLLIHLDAGGTAPAFKYLRLRSADQPPLSGKKLARKQWQRSQKELDLKAKESGFYVMQLREGSYQITEVNAPYFNLPHRLDTFDKREWRFNIEAGKVNYVGELFINAERSSSYVEIRLRNRLAVDLERIEAELHGLLATAPLVSGSGMRDDFFADLRANSND